MGGGAGGDFGKTGPKSKIIHNPVLDSKRIGSATKQDSHHAFNDIVDNYVGGAQVFSLRGGDGRDRLLYQIQGSLNGQSRIFEWIYDFVESVTHRLFIPNGRITGKPNSRGRE